MCGITGYISSNKYNTSLLENMACELNHRGPDDTGFFYENLEKKYLGLAHNRLSIIDLSQNGHQPMHFENLVIIFNGEIYNFKQIRKKLKKENYKFESDSDTEVALKAFHFWGIDAIKRFNGMFAIALYNKSEQKLYLFRDRIGIKPLYYFYNKSSLVFSSELKSIMKFPEFKKKLNIDKIYDFIFSGYIEAPHTIFKKTYKLLPGHYLLFDNKKIIINKYWDIKEKFNKRKILKYKNEKEYIDEFDFLLQKSVKKRMISDVPLGTFLSGGYDSSLITAIASKIANKKLKTFSIGFDNKHYDESLYASQISKYLGTDHHELILSFDKIKDSIEDFPRFYDEPFGDSSKIPTYFLSKLAKKQVTTVLSGDGGDELFCGYRRYDIVKKDNIIKYSSFFTKNLSFLDHILSKDNEILFKMRNLYSDLNIISKSYIKSKKVLNGLIKESGFNHNKYDAFNYKIKGNIQEKHMYVDFNTYLPDDILTKVDRASMAVSLEARVPLLDHKIIEYSFRIPHYLKYKNTEKKYLLKELSYKYIPRNLLERPKKGFSIPIYLWLHNELNYLVKKYTSKSFIVHQELFDFDKVKAMTTLFNNEYGKGYYEKFMWHFIVFQMWYEEYIK